MTALSTLEAAKYIGRSQFAVYALVAKKGIPFHKPGARKLVFFREELERWLMTPSHPPLEPVTVLARDLMTALRDKGSNLSLNEQMMAQSVRIYLRSLTK